MFVFSPSFFDYAERVAPSARGELELPSAIDAMLGDGVGIKACEILSWRHVGTPKDLTAETDVEAGPR